jgi:large subunit ribosomal protein L18
MNMTTATKSKTLLARVRHARLRKRLSGSTDRPRLAVFISNRHIYAQIIDDSNGTSIAAVSTLNKDVAKLCAGKKRVEQAAAVGEAIAKLAAQKGVQAVVFDRGGRAYHGRVRALSEAARKAGLTF